jgi:hypothetical protein
MDGQKGRLTMGEAGAGYEYPDSEDEALEQPLYLGGETIDDVIAKHLLECDQCRNATEQGKPARLGDPSGHCDQYWHLQLMRANYEGKINNIVHHTELGDEAPLRGRLE